MSLDCTNLPAQEKKNWFILYSDTPSGPFSYSELKNQENRGLISHRHVIWTYGWGKGISFKTLKSAYVLVAPAPIVDVEEVQAEIPKTKIEAPKKETEARAKPIPKVYLFGALLVIVLIKNFVMNSPEDTGYSKWIPKKNLATIQPQIVSDIVSTEASARIKDDALMRLDTLNMLSLKAEETFQWITREKFNPKKFHQSITNYQKNVGSHLMQIHFKNENDFREFSQKITHNDPNLYNLLKTSLISKKIGAMTMSYIESIQKSKNPKLNKTITQAWLKQMAQYRNQRFQEF